MNKLGKILSTTALAAAVATSTIVPINVMAEKPINNVNMDEVSITYFDGNKNVVDFSSSIQLLSLDNQVLLPPLEEYITENGSGYEEGLPPSTLDYQSIVEADLLDYVPVKMTISYLDLSSFYGIDDYLEYTAKEYGENVEDAYLGYIYNNKYYDDLIELFSSSITPETPFPILDVTLMVNPSSKIASNSKIKQNGYWKLVSNALRSSTEGESLSIGFENSYGVSREKGYEFAQSVGVTLSLTVGGGDVIPLPEVTTELSTEMSETFSQSIAIEEYFSESDTWEFKEQEGAYIGGIYNLRGQYSIVPGANLNSFIDGYPALSEPTPFTYQNSLYSAVVRLENKIQDPNLLEQFSINDFTQSSWSKNNVNVGYSSVTTPEGDFAQKLIQTDVNGAVQQYVDIDSGGKQYTFGVWLKADEPHQAQIKVQNQNNTESTGLKVDVTKDWQYFSVTSDQPFSTNDGVTAVIWPSAYGEAIDSVYVWGPELIEE
ncbi:phage head spike fiber domain-containing protein [Cytobacillus sp. Hm23]